MKHHVILIFHFIILFPGVDLSNARFSSSKDIWVLKFSDKSLSYVSQHVFTPQSETRYASSQPHIQNLSFDSRLFFFLAFVLLRELDNKCVGVSV